MMGINTASFSHKQIFPNHITGSDKFLAAHISKCMFEKVNQLIIYQEKINIYQIR